MLNSNLKVFLPLERLASKAFPLIIALIVLSSFAYASKYNTYCLLSFNASLLCFIFKSSNEEGDFLTFIFNCLTLLLLVTETLASFFREDSISQYFIRSSPTSNVPLLT